jgi:RNA polymerase sigma factor FliA
MGFMEDLDQPWEEHWRDGAPTGTVRHGIIMSFVVLVRIIALRLKSGLPPEVALDDLVSAGVVGLISAVDRFSPDKGHNFRSYAAIRIRGTMLDELRMLDWAPRSVRRDVANVERVRRELQGRLGRRETEEEMAEELGLDVAGYQSLMERTTPKRMLRLESLGYRRGEDGRSAISFLPDPSSPDPMRAAERRNSREAVVAAVDKLRERPRLMISLYYFEDLNLKEIAVIFGVTESRVSQIHTEALGSLRKKVRELN